jgi:hypothetical protein
MESRQRALIAAQPGAWSVLLGTLGDVMDLVPVHSRADAFQALKHDPDGIDLIISTIAFDESQMVEFLQAVKRDAELSRIPFLCSRVLPGVLPDHLVDGMRGVCKQCGAVDLLDVARLPLEKARSAFRTAVRSCLGH